MAGLRLGAACLALVAWSSAYAPTGPHRTPTTGDTPTVTMTPGNGLPAAGADGGPSTGRTYTPPASAADAAAANATARQLATAVTNGPGTGTGTSGSHPGGTTNPIIAIPLAPGDLGIPGPVLDAYRSATARLATEQPGCHLTWPTLAGIGKIESGNAAGRYISPDGTVTPTILGPRLDGTNATARILDTDHGTYDDDTTYDHAVGPMQFIPSTWHWAGRSAANPTAPAPAGNPNNIRDAAIAAAAYLCRAGNLADPATLAAAIHSYNPSDAYVHAVLAWAAGYTQANPGAVTTAAKTPHGTAAYTPGTAPTPRTVTKPPTKPTTKPASTTRPAVAPTTPSTTPPASPRPTPTTTCPAATLDTATVTATGIDTDSATPGLDTLRITGHLTAPATTSLTVALADRAGLPVTTATATAEPGAATTLANLAGYAIGDAGASGTFTLTITIASTTGCPGRAPVTATTGRLDAAAYTGWTTTLARLTSRLDELHTTGDLDAATLAILKPLVPAALSSPTDLAPFNAALATAHTNGTADALATTRLTSLTQRLAAAIPPPPTPTSPSPTPTSPPSTTTQPATNGTPAATPTLPGA
jgi:hypothetical protein